jgi:hypothetical protein
MHPHTHRNATLAAMDGKCKKGERFLHVNVMVGSLD